MAKQSVLTLDNNGFFYKNDHFSYDEINYLYFYYVQVQKTMNFVASGIDHEIDAKIYIKGRSSPLEIKTGPRFLSFHGFSFGEKSSQSLIAKWNELCRMTFKNRAEKYLQSWHEFGYFNYDEKKFFKNGDISSHSWTFNIYRDGPLLKSPFLLFIEITKGNWLFSAKRREIRTLIDSDVLFSMLASFYKKHWR
ncbi:hypothetical protein AAFN86_13055 [Roseomonas sp. CAU 1739]|uniref:hypothetical protein n=1 Tax=Roseomonas sp. CAU 1739 TaxID=3140364 RepID=UPI00325A9E24